MAKSKAKAEQTEVADTVVATAKETEKPVEAAAKSAPMAQSEAPKKAKKKASVAVEPVAKPKQEEEPDLLELINSPVDDDDDDIDEDPDKTPVEKAKVEPKAEPVQPQRHSERSLRLAQYYGIPLSEVKAMSREELLAEIQAAKIEQEAIEAREAKQAAKKAEKPAEEEDEFKELEGEVSPQVLNALRAGKSSQKELAKLRAEFEEREQARSRQEFERNLEAFYASRSEIFGRGLSAKFPAGTAERIKRSAVFGTLQAMAQAGQLTTLEEDLETITNSLFGKGKAKAEPEEEEEEEEVVVAKQPTPQELELAKRKKDFAEGGLAKPTARIADMPLGEKRALANLGRLVKAREAYRDEVEGDPVKNGFFDN